MNISTLDAAAAGYRLLSISFGISVIAAFAAAAYAFLANAKLKREWRHAYIHVRKHSYMSAYCLAGLSVTIFCGAWALCRLVLARSFMLPAYFILALFCILCVTALAALVYIIRAMRRSNTRRGRALLKLTAAVILLCGAGAYGVSRYWIALSAPQAFSLLGHAARIATGAIAVLAFCLMILFAAIGISGARHDGLGVLPFCLGLSVLSGGIAYILARPVLHVNMGLLAHRTLRLIYITAGHPAFWAAALGIPFGMAVRHVVIHGPDPSFNMTSAQCGRCFKSVSPQDVKEGRCPHCGVVWTSERSRYRGLSPADIQRRKVALANLLCTVIVLLSCFIAVKLIFD